MPGLWGIKTTVWAARTTITSDAPPSKINAAGKSGIVRKKRSTRMTAKIKGMAMTMMRRRKNQGEIKGEIQSFVKRRSEAL